MPFPAAARRSKLRLYCLGCAGGFCAGGVVAGVVPDGVVVAGFFATGFFFTAGFFGGSVSSTTVFFGGSVGIAACAVFRSARRRTISCSFDVARLSRRSASAFKLLSRLSKSLERAW